MKMPTRLSMLWIFVVLNYLYADVLTLFDLVLIAPEAATTVGSFQITRGFLFWGGVLVEVSIAMIILSRVLPYHANRLANMLAGGLETLAVTATLFFGTPTLYYSFFAAIEIGCTLTIVWYAWRWKDEGHSGRGAEAFR